MTDRSFKVTVCFERRPDGGLRAYSDDVPGLVLSHTDIDGVLADVTEALRVILSHHANAPVVVEPLENVRALLERGGIVDPSPAGFSGAREYVAYVH